MTSQVNAKDHDEPAGRNTLCRALSMAAGVIVVVLGSAVLAGWLFHVPLLKSILPDLVSMKPNTALAFFLAGAGLMLLLGDSISARRVRVGQVLGLLAAMLGALTLFEFVFGCNFRIDELLFKDDPAAVATSIPGRMAPSTAVSFLLLGLALFKLDWEPRRGFRPAEVMALIPCLLGLGSLAEYVSGQPMLFSFAQYTRMAVHTAVGFLVLSLGVLLACPARGVVGALCSGRINRKDSLICAAMALLFVVVLAGGGWFYHAQEQHVQREVEVNLVAVARLKVDQIVQWRAECIGDAGVLVGSEFLREGIQRWMKNPQPEGQEKILSRFRALQKYGKYQDILLVDKLGKVLLSLSDHRGDFHDETVQSMAAAFQTRQPVMTDLHIPPGGPVPHFEIIAPFFAGNEPTSEPMCAIIIQQDARQSIYPLIQSWPTTSASAETLLVRRDGASVLFISEVRHHPDSSFNLRIPLTKKEVPEVMVALGKEGVCLGTDYRGAKVLSVLRKIPDTSWFMVSKMDETEAFAEWRMRGKLILAMMLALMLALGIASSTVWVQRNKNKAVRESEERFRLMVDNVKDYAIIMLDATGYVSTWNAGVERIKGYRADEIIGQHFSRFYPKEDVESGKPERELMVATAEGRFEEDEGWRVRKDGSRFIANVVITALRDAAGQLRGFAKITRDVTKGILAEQAIRASERDKSLVLENANEIIGYHDRDQRLVWVNNKYLAGVRTNTGLPVTVEEVKGRKCFDAWGLGKVCNQCPVAEAIRTGTPREAVLTPQNQPHWPATQGCWLIRAAPVRDSAGAIIGAIEMAHDITDRLRAEDALRELNAQLEQRVAERTRELVLAKNEAEAAMAREVVACKQVEQAARDRTFFFSVNLDMFCIAGFDGYFRDLNPTWERNLGYSFDELRAKPFIEFVHADDRQSTLDAAAALSRGEDVVSFENRYRCKDGSYRWIKWNSRSVIKEGLIFAAAHDVTDSKRLELELRAARDAADAANRAKSEFLANVSHEIRTPMNAIIGMTDLVLETPLTRDQKHFLTTVRESTDSLLGVLNDILDFAKIEAGRLDLEETHFGLRDVVEGTGTTLAERAHRKGLELVCHVSPEVPDTLVGDAGRLRQILVNLIGNAIKFTAHGEVVVRVAVEGEERGMRHAERGAVNGEQKPACRFDELCRASIGQLSVDGDQSAVINREPGTLNNERFVTLHFSVGDTGIGIPPEKQKVIFEPFRQADASITREYGGTGLGLAISSQLSARMHGRIWAESEVGHGSVFHFTARFGTTTDARPKMLPASLPQLKDMRVLIVDDNATNRLIYEELIGAWGMRPTVASGGEEALAVVSKTLAAGSPFALALLDRQMPAMDGYEVAQRLRGKPELGSMVILMLTSSSDLGDAERLRELGIAACLVKPVRQSELLNTILRVMGIVTNGHHKTEATPDVRPLRILLVEDHPVNQELATHLLEKRGHTVALAENGQEAVDRLSKDDFDVVLMDIQMPVMDGFAATAAIRDPESSVRRHDIPIVAMTAHAMKGDRERCLAAGMNAYVSKPIQAATLIGALVEMCGHPTSNIQHPAFPMLGVECATFDVQTVCPPHSDTPILSSSVFDSTALLERVEGDAVLAKKMATRFLDDAPARLAALDVSVELSDAESLVRHAHTLKGAAATLGGCRAQAACLRFETAARGGDIAATTGMIAEVKREVAALEQELREFVEA